MMEVFALIMMAVAVIAIAATGAAEAVRPHEAPARAISMDYGFTADMVCKEM